MSDVSIAMVIPTRNRADMAINAIRHLRDQPDCVQVFVSDNSSNDDEVQRLAAFCRELDDPRVMYVRAPEDLGQGRHWDWATREALRRADATHVTVHYDRKVFRPGHARFLCDVAARFPDKVVTYVSDSVSFVPPPLRLWQPAWSGKLFTVKTDKTIAASARGEAFETAHTLPILSNCIVPRAVVDKLVDAFGTFCASTTGDSCFAYRFLATHEDYLHLDRSLAILYGSQRSAGIGYLRGVGGDFADYRKTWNGDDWLAAAPIPGLNLGYNMLFHEYELVRQSPAGARLPPLDRAGCLRDLARGLTWIDDERARADLRKLLVDEGWTGDFPALTFEERPASALRRAYRKLRQRTVLFLGDHFGVAPRTISGFVFAEDADAVRYGLKFPSQPTTLTDHLGVVEPVEVAP